MIASFKNKLQALQVTTAIAWSIVGTLLAGLTGPIVALLIAERLTPQMQGYYYTFSSLLAMAVFLELGFNSCIVQFISHEYAHLSVADGQLVGNSSRALSRLSSLTRLSLRWYSIGAVLLFACIGVGGEIFFRINQGDGGVDWRIPWWCLCALSSINLLFLPLTGLLEGCDQINWTARSRIFQNLGRSIVLIGGLFCGLGLYSPAAATFAALAIFACQFKLKWGNLLSQILRVPVGEKVSWLREILPMQWRMAVSWACGYFIFSMFNPLLFSYSGPHVAGQFGMTWAFLTAINSISMAFVNTRGPRFAVLTATGDWDALRSAWRVSVIQSSLVYAITSLGFLLTLMCVATIDGPLRARLLDTKTIMILISAGFINQVILSIAILVRAGKREPFLYASVVTAVVVAVSSYLTVRDYSAMGLAVSYLLGMIVSAVFAYFIILKSWRRFDNRSPVIEGSM